MIVHAGHTSTVWSVTFSTDGKSVVSGSSDRTVRMWDTHSSSPIGKPLRGPLGPVRSVSYSPLGNFIASGSEDKTLRLWDTSTGRQSGEALGGDRSTHSIAFSPDAKLIAAGYGYSLYFAGSPIQLWNVQTRKLASGPLKGHGSIVASVSFSPDATRLVSGSYDETIRLWDVERGTTILTLEGHTDLVYSTVISLDGAQILSCSNDGAIRFWDTRSGGMIGEPYKGHSGAVYSAVFSPHGTYVASGGKDKTVRLWDIRNSCQVDQPLEEHTDAVRSVAYSPCGQYIVSGSDDCKVIIRRVLGGNPDPVGDAGPQSLSGEMSTQQMFECLRDAGCVDLSSQMDPRQETVMIVSGGGFGDIWQGRVNNGTKVTIKVWRTSSVEQCDHATLKRTAHELFDMFKMDHPNVHQLQGVIMFKDQYLGVVSEWVENGNIYEYLMRSPNANRYQLCAQVASGLDYMHSYGKVHGDLKAAHVLVSADGIARISQLDSSVMSEISSLVLFPNSTIRWAAPEILLEDVQQKTTKTDMYALGMTMLEIFTGEPPYADCRSDVSVIKSVERGILPSRPTKLANNQKNDKIWRLLVRCWSRSPQERPSSGFIAGALEYMS